MCVCACVCVFTCVLVVVFFFFFFFWGFFFFFLRFLKGERAREDESSRSPSSSLATLFRKKTKTGKLVRAVHGVELE